MSHRIIIDSASSDEAITGDQFEDIQCQAQQLVAHEAVEKVIVVLSHDDDHDHGE